MSDPTTAIPPKEKKLKPLAEKPTPSEAGSGIGTSLSLSLVIGVIAMLSIIGIFAAKNSLGNYFGLVYYIGFPIFIYFVSVGISAIIQRGYCSKVTNISSCFLGAINTLIYIYVAMIAVNIIGPNGIFTLETSNTSTPSIKPPKIVPLNNVNSIPLPVALSQSAPPPDVGFALVNAPPEGQGGGAKPPLMSDTALMIRSFFTTLRAPAMSLFIRDPNAATLEDTETKYPIYTGIGVGYWVCLAAISGQIMSNATAQTC
jgi:hypothetical protein